MTVEASTSAGILEGTRAGNICTFRGVRYATAKRFALPEPVASWSGARPARHRAPAAPQTIGAVQAVPDMAVGETGEDCLAAEIWTPDPTGNRPVLVWIPGGRYQIGGAGLATYDGSRLAEDGNVVVVGLNYRLGALGFLAADEVPANLGLHDLLAALRWLRAEATAFGGDPTRIIVMGESAGAGAICHLLAIPETASLVAGAIVQSGAPGATLDPSDAATVTAALLRAAAVDSVEGLRPLPLDALLAAQASADAEMLATVGMMPFHPMVDGTLLERAPLDAARAGTLAAIPLVIGTTNNEMELFRAAVPRLPTEYAVRFLTPKLARTLGRTPAAELVARGLAAVDDDTLEAIADIDLHVPAALIADAHAERGIPVWRYRFDWQAPGIGAAHATDLPFTFGTLDTSDWRSFVGATGEDTDPADRLSARMRQAWTGFCHRLHPACDPIGAWPEHDPIRRATVVVGRDVTVADDPDGARFRAWTDRT